MDIFQCQSELQSTVTHCTQTTLWGEIAPHTVDCGASHKVALSAHYKLYLRDNLKTTEANLMKLLRKIKHNEKVCRAQEFSPYAQGQGHSWVKGHIVPKKKIESQQ